MDNLSAFDGVVIAPTRRLSQHVVQTSINDQGNLPLGNESAIVRQKYNDDVLDTMSPAPYIADVVERNKQNNREELRILPRDLVGKKANEVAPFEADLSIMRRQNLLLDKKAMDYEMRWYMEGQINGAWMPFTTAETFHYGSQPFATVENTDQNTMR
jgi:hypothetical protein